MKSFLIIGGIGAMGAVVLGVGVSLAHTNGMFAPDEPDWLALSKATAAGIPAPVDLAPVDVAVVADVAAPAAAIAPTPATVAVEIPATFAPIASPAPQMRPIQTASAPAPTPAPRLVVEPVAPVVAVAPQSFEVGPLENAPAANTPVASADMQSRAKTPDAQYMAAPAAPSATTGIGDVWLLGVFR